MTCPACGVYGEPDPETGYDGDDLCPTCQAAGWDLDGHGHVFHERTDGHAEDDDLPHDEP
jgi:hypothetical protein